LSFTCLTLFKYAFASNVQAAARTDTAKEETIKYFDAPEKSERKQKDLSGKKEEKKEETKKVVVEKKSEEKKKGRLMFSN
jgi:hypothetical protein